MNLREEASTTTSPSLRFPATTSLPTTTLWTAGISFLPTTGPSSIQRTFDHSFADGVSQELHFELPQYGPATKPLNWKVKPWNYVHHTQFPDCYLSCAASYYEHHKTAVKPWQKPSQ